MSKNTRSILMMGNWKMNHTAEETRLFLADLNRLLNEAPRSLKNSLSDGRIRMTLAPPAVHLQSSVTQAKEFSFPLHIAAQNAHFETNGAFTGEISASILKSVGVESSLVGHSERRQFFGDSNEICQQKTISLLKQGLEVVLCIGETREERESNQTQKVLSQQLEAALLVEKQEIQSFLLSGKLIIAYEPVWAIGTGLTATPEQAEETHQMVRRFIWDHFGMEAAGRTCILYGGSVKPENAYSLLRNPNIDGALIGGASLKAESFFELLVEASRSLE